MTTKCYKMLLRAGLVLLATPFVLLASDLERRLVADIVEQDLLATPDVPEPLRIWRDVEVEGICTTLGLLAGPWTYEDPPLFRFYRVRRGGVAVEDGKIVMESRAFLLGAPLEWRVAIRHSDSKLYRISGFEHIEPDQPDYSQLVKDLDLHLESEDDATKALSLYLYAYRGQELRHTLWNETHLRGLATTDFAKRCRSDQVDKALRSWWKKGVAKFAKRSEFGWTVTEHEDAFHIKYSFYSWGRVWEEVAVVASDGLLEIVSKEQFGSRSAAKECDWRGSYD
jgi:hypothetical protein